MIPILRPSLPRTCNLCRKMKHSTSVRRGNLNFGWCCGDAKNALSSSRHDGQSVQDPRSPDLAALPAAPPSLSLRLRKRSVSSDTDTATEDDDEGEDPLQNAPAVGPFPNEDDTLAQARDPREFSPVPVSDALRMRMNPSRHFPGSTGQCESRHPAAADPPPAKPNCCPEKNKSQQQEKADDTLKIVRGAGTSPPPTVGATSMEASPSPSPGAFKQEPPNSKPPPPHVNDRIISPEPPKSKPSQDIRTVSPEPPKSKPPHANDLRTLTPESPKSKPNVNGLGTASPSLTLTKQGIDPDNAPASKNLIRREGSPLKTHSISPAKEPEIQQGHKPPSVTLQGPHAKEEPQVSWKKHPPDNFGTLTISRKRGPNYVLRIPVAHQANAHKNRHHPAAGIARGPEPKWSPPHPPSFSGIIVVLCIALVAVTAFLVYQKKNLQRR